MKFKHELKQIEMCCVCNYYYFFALSLITDLGSKYQPIVIMDDNDSEIDSEDAALSALLHEKVIKVKQEIDWDLEEQKLREKRRKKELKLREESSSDEESDSAVRAEVRWHRRNGRGKWAWPAHSSLLTSNREMMSGSNNCVQGGGPQHLAMIDSSSQIFTTVSLQPGLESEDPNDQDDTIVYSQHDNSVTLYPVSQSMLDTTGTCSTELDGCESTDSISDVPLDVSVQNHQPFQNSCSIHQPEPAPTPLNKLVLAGSLTHSIRDSNNKSRRESEFLSSINSETDLDQPSTTSVYKPTLDAQIYEPTCTFPASRESNAIVSTPGPSNRQHHSPTSTRVKPFNVVDIIRIESQTSSTEEELLSGTASEAEDSRCFSTRQTISCGQSSAAAVNEPREDGNIQAISHESESELDRASRIRPGDDETSEELLLSGYESGYVDTITQTSTHVSTLASPRSHLSSSTPPPNDDAMTPPPSPERQTSTPTLKPLQLSLTPVCTSPQRDGQLTNINPPLPATCTPLTEAQVAEVGGPEDNATNASSSVASIGETKMAANIETIREIDQQHPPSTTNDVGKDVSTEFAQDCDETSLNPEPAVNESDTTARDIHQQPSTQVVPSTEPSPSNDNLTGAVEIAQNVLSKSKDGIDGCMCCPWQSPGSVCAHCSPIFSPCLSCACHMCTYDHHCHSCIQMMSPKIGHTSPPHKENHMLYCSSYIPSSNITLATITNTYGDSTHSLAPSDISNLCSPPPATEDHGENHTHFASSCCSHISNVDVNGSSPTSHAYSHNMCCPCACTQHSSTQEERHTHPMSPCSSLILTTPPSCTCSALQSSPYLNNGLSSQLFAIPSPQLMLPLSLKRNRDGSEDLSSDSNSNGSEISSPPAKRQC